MNSTKIKSLDLSKMFPKKIFTKSGNKIYNLNVVLFGEKILISEKRHKYDGTINKEFLTVPKNQICLWYKWPAGRNQHNKENKGNRFKYVLLPRFIKLDKLTSNAFGLLQAEMTKHTKRASNIIFTNSDPNLINIVLKFFERLFIDISKWSWSITFNFKLKNNENFFDTTKREKEALNFWISNSLINPYKNQNKHLQYTGNKWYVNMRPNSPKYGSLRISFSNIIIYQLILKLLQDIKELIKEDPNYIKYYLQGIFAGECYVKPTRYKSLDSIRIGCVDENERMYYYNLLTELNIKSSIEKEQIAISNQKNFLNIFKLELIKLHLKKYKVFLTSLLGFKQISLGINDEFLIEKEKIKKELTILNKKEGDYNEKDYLV